MAAVPPADALDRSDRSARAQRMALDSMNHRRRPGTGILVVIAVVAVFVALVVVGSQKSHKTAHATSTSTTSHPSRVRRLPTTTTPKPTPTTRPTPTTLPNQFVATTTASSGSAATYTVPHTTFQITITGTGSCWVEVDSAIHRQGGVGR